MPKIPHQFSRKLILAVVFMLLIAGIFWLRNFPDFVESYYSIGLYPYIANALQWVYGLLPFSFGDIVYVATIMLALFGLAKLIRYLISSKFKAAAHLFLKGVIGLELFIVIFYLFWGINYFRHSAAKRLNLTDTCYTNADLAQITSMLIDSANACRSALKTSDLEIGDRAIFDTSIEAIKSFSIHPGFGSYHPQIKKSLFSVLLNYAGTSGYYNPLTAEAQLNYKMPVFLKPFTSCHEMAHQMGFAAEDEANFAGFVIGVSSTDRLLKYSSYYLGAAECLSNLKLRDSVSYKQLRIHISPEVLNDFRIDQEYWMKYQGRISVVTGLFFDNYLKANNQPEGLRRYNLMLRLVMGWYRQNETLKSMCTTNTNGLP